MIDYFQDLFTTAFDFDGVDRSARKFAFAQLMVSAVIVIGVPFRVLMYLGDKIGARRANAALFAEVTSQLPVGATRELAQDLMAREQVNRRRAYTAPLLPPIELSAEPVDGSYFATLRHFAEEKIGKGAAMNEYEREAAGPIAFLCDSFASLGFGQFDALKEMPPYRSHELSNMMGRLGLDDMVPAVEAAMSIHLQRYQMFQDFIATGMPADQAKKHPKLPTYDALDNSIKTAGGLDRLVRAVNQYLEGAYPWIPDSGF
jgi:hypothetical protein